MKIVSIGRSGECDIVIDDGRVSRRHAILRVYPLGKMEIIDLSQNGTWVNGVKLKTNVPFPVKRKDVVNFAGASQLNWSLVPDSLKYIRYGILAALALALLIIGILSLSKCKSDEVIVETPTTSVETHQPSVITPKEKDAKPTPAVREKPSYSDSEEMESPSKNVKKGRTVDYYFPIKANPQPSNNKAKDEKKQTPANKNKKDSSKKDSDKKQRTESKRVVM